jgi:hypothetical protein
MLYKIYYVILTVLFTAQMAAPLNSNMSILSAQIAAALIPYIGILPAQMLEVLLLYMGIIAVLIGVSPIAWLLIQCPVLIFLPPVFITVSLVIQMLIETIPYGCIGAVILFFSLITYIFIKQDYDRNQEYIKRKNN